MRFPSEVWYFLVTLLADRIKNIGQQRLPDVFCPRLGPGQGTLCGLNSSHVFFQNQRLPETMDFPGRLELLECFSTQ